MLIPPWLQAIYRLFLSRSLYEFQRVCFLIDEPCLPNVSAELIRSPYSPENPIFFVAMFTRLAHVTGEVEHGII